MSANKAESPTSSTRLRFILISVAKQPKGGRWLRAGGRMLKATRQCVVQFLHKARVRVAPWDRTRSTTSPQAS
eukprot:scaffold10812_cov28-Tisochrysis_lutea.AAC.5